MSDAEGCKPVDMPSYNADAVIQDYLDFMLRAVTEPPVQAPVQASREMPATALARAVSAPAAVTAPASHPVPPLPVAAEPVNSAPAQAAGFLQQRASEAQAAPQRAANGRPRWAQQEFPGLLFQVSGLKLVAALTELGGITELGELIPIFAQPDWFMGLLRWNGRNIRVIDTARLIMPERTAAGDAHRASYHCVLMLNDSDWGLAIDSNAESIRLSPDEVRWRDGSASRPWLAGTLAERLCALLDVQVLTQRLLQPEGFKEQGFKEQVLDGC